MLMRKCLLNLNPAYQANHAVKAIQEAQVIQLIQYNLENFK